MTKANRVIIPPPLPPLRLKPLCGVCHNHGVVCRIAPANRAAWLTALTAWAERNDWTNHERCGCPAGARWAQDEAEALHDREVAA